ncbi:unnamed protein product [Parnassius apollo]|uniref:(apollo) hypothetical protein n=1 Tax=Parnassius apollo TaxID=110799 RepID=A0A8S3WS60_PARAO|nr:unnamed protein product [Parnassius apollo]
MDKLENNLLDIKNQNSKIENTNTDIETSMNFISEQITSLVSKITYLEQERITVDNKISLLEEKMETHDRSCIKTSVEIRNLPKRIQESKKDLYDMLIKLSKLIEIDLQVSDIRDVSRQYSKKENKTSNLTVEFSNTLIKSNFLSLVKNYNKRNSNNKLDSSHLGLDGPLTPIYHIYH